MVVGTKLGIVELSELEGYRGGDKLRSTARFFIFLFFKLPRVRTVGGFPAGDGRVHAHTRSLALPSPDGPQNQIESNTAIIEAELRSEGEEIEK